MATEIFLRLMDSILDDLNLDLDFGTSFDSFIPQVPVAPANLGNLEAKRGKKRSSVMTIEEKSARARERCLLG